MPDLDAQLAAVRERSTALPDLPAADLIRHVVANSRVRLRLEQFNLCAITEGDPMQAGERTRTVVHHEWVLATPAHETEVVKALAVAEQRHDAEPGHPTDIEFAHGDGQIVIGYRVERHLESEGYAVNQIIRAERDELDRRNQVMSATLGRVRALAVAWSGEDAEFGRHWREAARALHETLDGPGDEAGER